MANPSFPQFLNICANVTIGKPPNQGVFVETLKGEGLLIEWSVTMDISNASNYGSISIHNLDSETQIPFLKKISTSVGGFRYPISLGFGWDGRIFELYKAPALKILPSIETGVDYVTSIEFSDFAEYKDRTPYFVQLDNATWEAAFEAAAQLMELKLSKQFKDELKKTNVVTEYSTVRASVGEDPRKDFSFMVASLGPGYNWTVQNGEVFLTKFGQMDIGTDPYILGYDSGLLTFSPQDVGSFSIECLGIPFLRPGQQVIVLDNDDQKVGSGPLRIESISWTGSSYSGCTSTILARRLGEFY